MIECFPDGKQTDGAGNFVDVEEGGEGVDHQFFVKFNECSGFGLEFVLLSVERPPLESALQYYRSGGSLFMIRINKKLEKERLNYLTKSLALIKYINCHLLFISKPTTEFRFYDKRKHGLNKIIRIIMGLLEHFILNITFY